MIDTELTQNIGAWLVSFAPDQPVVVVPIFNAFDDVLECIDSLLATTPLNVPLLFIDDASTDERILQVIPHRVAGRGYYARRQVNSGFVDSMNLAFASCTPRDVVLINSDVVLPSNWLERLRDAAYSRTTIATATPLTNSGTILSVPDRGTPRADLPESLNLSQVDARIAAASLKLRPILPTAIGHCTYFKRTALDIVGAFDPVFSPGYGEEVDFSLRAISVGFCHVAADDLFVYHKGSRSFAGHNPERELARRTLLTAHAEIINQRYPWYQLLRAKVLQDDSNLSLALDRACAALLGYSIAIEALCIHDHITGTIVLTLEIANALANAINQQKPSQQFDISLTLIVADNLPRHLLRGLDKRITVMEASEFQFTDKKKFDLIHRPYQINSLNDLSFLLKVARRCVISQLDCIAFATPSYAPNAEAWQAYCIATEQALQFADGVVFISQDAAEDAAHRGLHVPHERACVSYLGVDHQLFSTHAEEPTAHRRLYDEPFLLTLSTNFLHKNRPLAIRAFGELVQRYGWNGRLILRGPHVSFGGSMEAEAKELEALPLTIRERVHDLGNMNEAEKAWVLPRAAALLYPSHYEGFGMPPFEAALLGVPSLATRTTSLIETLGEQVDYVKTMNADTWADAIWEMISDPIHAQKQVKQIELQAVKYSWNAGAEQLLQFYSHILQLPKRSLDSLLTHISDANRDGANAALAAPTRSWAERARLGLNVLKKEGWKGLKREIDQYLTWWRKK